MLTSSMGGNTSCIIESSPSHICLTRLTMHYVEGYILLQILKRGQLQEEVRLRKKDGKERQRRGGGGGGEKERGRDSQAYVTSDVQLALEAALKIGREENRSKGTLTAIPMPHKCLITWREKRRRGRERERRDK